MTGAERGFLLLTSQLGCPERKALTVPQLRNLTNRVRWSTHTGGQRDLEMMDLLALGYSREQAGRILALLSEEDLLEGYLRIAKKSDCVPLTRVSTAYPGRLRERMGPEAPGCLWAKGDLSILEMEGIALVGSRELREENRAYAREVGRQAALQGFALISGNAKGADSEAQNACLEQGGRVISVIADRLDEKKAIPNVLYLSEQGYDLPFSPQRALSRNHVIHCLGALTFVAQCSYRTGGTWDGTLQNLKSEWSPVFCVPDGSPGIRELVQLGAAEAGAELLQDFRGLMTQTQNLSHLLRLF